jgi:hypothetical protein
MRQQDRRQKGRGARELEVLGATPSNWRIFNVGQHLRALRGRGVERATLFSNRRLDDAIILKHALRPNERDLFERAPMIATKVLVPIDPLQVSLGAISFFVGERGVNQTLMRAFGIRHDPARGISDRDAEILAVLDGTPSLDLFLLRELLCSDRFNVSTEIFSLSLAADPHFRTFIYRELAPLVNFAIGSTEPAKVYRFVDSIFGASLGPLASDFLMALGLPQPRWAEIVFAWKAALFYEKSAGDMRRRFEAMVAQLKALRTYGHTDSYPRSLILNQQRELAETTARAFARCLSNIAHFNSQRRATLIASGSTAALSAYLDALPASVLDYGSGAALVDHILSYWTYCARGYEIERFPAETFSIIASDICSIDNQYNAAGDQAWAS